MRDGGGWRRWTGVRRASSPATTGRRRRRPGNRRAGRRRREHDDHVVGSERRAGDPDPVTVPTGTPDRARFGTTTDDLDDTRVAGHADDHHEPIGSDDRSGDDRARRTGRPRPRRRLRRRPPRPRPLHDAPHHDHDDHRPRTTTTTTTIPQPTAMGNDAVPQVTRCGWRSFAGGAAAHRPGAELGERLPHDARGWRRRARR